MAINVLQREAFLKSDDFNAQVDGIVAKTGIYRSGAWQYVDEFTRQQLAQVAKSPQSFGFTSVMVTDNNWTLTYDAWTADPPGADAVIESFVQTHWLLLTGIVEPGPPAEEPA